MLDLIIIGAGAAGLTAAIYSARYGLKTKLFDGSGAGGQLLVIDEIENYPSHSKISGFELASQLEEQAKAFGIEITLDSVTEITQSDQYFVIKTALGKKEEARAILIATGSRHKRLNVKGEEQYTGRGVSYCATCDGNFFRNKSVAVVGGGDTALTDALFLSKICSEVTVIHRREKLRAQRILVERAKAAKNISFALSETIEEIIGDGNRVTELILKGGRRLSVSALFVLVGTEPSSELVKDLVKREKGFIVTNERMETSTPGIFAAGDVRTTPLRQVVTACSDGAIAASSIEEYITSLNS